VDSDNHIYILADTNSDISDDHIPLPAVVVGWRRREAMATLTPPLHLAHVKLASHRPDLRCHGEDPIGGPLDSGLQDHLLINDDRLTMAQESVHRESSRGGLPQQRMQGEGGLRSFGKRGTVASTSGPAASGPR
jgi:hypothetical protein